MTVDRVELQTNGDIYRVLGPAIVPSEAEKPHTVQFTFPPKRG